MIFYRLACYRQKFFRHPSYQYVCGAYDDVSFLLYAHACGASYALSFKNVPFLSRALLEQYIIIQTDRQESTFEIERSYLWQYLRSMRHSY